MFSWGVVSRNVSIFNQPLSFACVWFVSFFSLVPVLLHAQLVTVDTNEAMRSESRVFSVARYFPPVKVVVVSELKLII